MNGEHEHPYFGIIIDELCKRHNWQAEKLEGGVNLDDQEGGFVAFFYTPGENDTTLEIATDAFHKFDLDDPDSIDKIEFELLLQRAQIL